MTKGPVLVLALVSVLVAAIGFGVSTGRTAAAGLTVSAQGLAPYRTCTLTATPSTTTVVSDAVVKQGSATSNFGTATTLVVSSFGTANQRVYLRFDLSQCNPAIPTTAIVRAATLRLYASALPSVCRTLDVFDVLAAWTETGITWNNQPFGTTLNNPASATASDTFAVGAATGCQNLAAGYVVGATVTADVAAWVAGPATNHGWMLRDDVEGSATARTTTFSAKNLGTLAQAPQLIVTYVVVA